MDTEQRERIGQLYLENFDLLMAYARRISDNDALAEEAVQETFRIACQKPDQLCGSPNPCGWLVLTLKKTVRNMRVVRSHTAMLMERYYGSCPKETAAPEDALPTELLYQDMADTEEYRLLTELAIEGRSYLEIAQSRGITVDACKKRIQRARKALQKKIRR